jgi:hypothetical protein
VDSGQTAEFTVNQGTDPALSDCAKPDAVSAMVAASGCDMVSDGEFIDVLVLLPDPDNKTYQVDGMICSITNQPPGSGDFWAASVQSWDGSSWTSHATLNFILTSSKGAGEQEIVLEFNADTPVALETDAVGFGYVSTINPVESTGTIDWYHTCEVKWSEVQ